MTLLAASPAAVGAPTCFAPMDGGANVLVLNWMDLGPRVLATTQNGLLEVADGALKPSAFGVTNEILSFSTINDKLLVKTRQGWFLLSRDRLQRLTSSSKDEDWVDKFRAFSVLSTTDGLFVITPGNVTTLPPDVAAPRMNTAALLGDTIVYENGFQIFRWNRSGRHELKLPGIESEVSLFSVGDQVVVSGAPGLFVVRGDKVEPILAGPVLDAHQPPNAAFIYARTEKNWVQYDGDRLHVLESPDVEAADGWFELSGARTGLRTDSGKLLIFDRSSVRRVVEAGFAESPGAFVLGSNQYIATRAGLYQLTGTQLARLSTNAAGSFRKVYAIGKVDVRGGPYQLERLAVVFEDETIIIDRDGASRVVSQRFPEEVIENRATAQIGDRLLVIASDGWYGLSADGRVQLLQGPRPMVPMAIVTGEASALIYTAEGWLIFEGDSVKALSGSPDTGKVYAYWRVGEHVVLYTARGMFASNGRTIWPLSGVARTIHNAIVSETGIYASTDTGIVRAVDVPLSEAVTSLRAGQQASGRVDGRAIAVGLQFVHTCATAARDLDLHVNVTDPKGRTSAPISASVVEIDGSRTVVQVPLAFNDAGAWRLQIVSRSALGDNLVGGPLEIMIGGDPFQWLKERWDDVLKVSGGLLVAANILVFMVAAWSPRALRLATDEAWGKKPITIAMFLLRHFRTAQLWILRLYVTRSHDHVPYGSAPFLAMPVRLPDGEARDVVEELARWPQQQPHLWIQGNAGMGKTAIFQRLAAQRTGRDVRNAYQAVHEFGAVVVPIEARRFAASGDAEKGAHGWVVAAVRDAMSERGFSVADPSLLHAMFKTGVLSIAIDGLNEIGRERAVLAFAQQYPDVPILVLSQSRGELPFQTDRLPSDITNHVDDLLKLYLEPHKAAELIRQVRESRLIEDLRSGYDVMLLVILASRADADVAIPDDRAELYEAFVSAAWPADDNRRPILQAAAWTMFSDSAPNRDRRRLKPEADAPADLLQALAGVTAHDGRRVRLMRPADGNFEFVHEQMAAFLAACWLTKEMASVAALIQELEDSHVWSEGRGTQQTLWEFVAAKLSRSDIEELWYFSAKDDRRVILRRILEERAAHEGWELSLRPKRDPRRARPKPDARPVKTS